MNLWDHLGELRRRLLICIYCMLAGTVAGVFAVDPVISWLARPVGELIFLHPTEAFTAQAKIALGVSFLICLPVILYQAWAFVSTGLEPREKRYILWAVPFSYVAFLLGFGFAGWFVFPRAVNFLLTMRSSHLAPMLSIESYLDFFGILGLVFGGLFQLPLILHFLSRVGILRLDFLEKNRRISYLAIFIFATLFNMSPEVFTQVLIAISGIVLFELSILLVRWEARHRLK
jgi:sec-independent protein translocase protein TatC